MQQSKERNCLSMVNITDFIASLTFIKKLTQCHMSYGKVFVMQTIATLLLNKRFKGLKGHLRIRDSTLTSNSCQKGPFLHISCTIIE